MRRTLGVLLFVIYIIIGVVVGGWTPLPRASRRAEVDRLESEETVMPVDPEE